MRMCLRAPKSRMKRVEKSKRQNRLYHRANINQSAHVERVVQEWIWDWVRCNQWWQSRRELEDVHIPLELAQYSTQHTYQSPKRMAVNGATRVAWYSVYLFSKRKKSSTSATAGTACRARSTRMGILINARAVGADVGSPVDGLLMRMR